MYHAYSTHLQLFLCTYVVSYRLRNHDMWHSAALRPALYGSACFVVEVKAQVCCARSGVARVVKHDAVDCLWVDATYIRTRRKGCDAFCMETLGVFARECTPS
jgi:hypothetical protein